MNTTRTPEQQQALDELVSLVSGSKGTPAKYAQKPAEGPEAAVDWLKTWLGLSNRDVKAAVEALLKQKDAFETKLLDWVEANPLDANFQFLGLTSWAIYQA